MGTNNPGNRPANRPASTPNQPAPAASTSQTPNQPAPAVLPGDEPTPDDLLRAELPPVTEAVVLSSGNGEPISGDADEEERGDAEDEERKRRNRQRSATRAATSFDPKKQRVVAVSSSVGLAGRSAPALAGQEIPAEYVDETNLKRWLSMDPPAVRVENTKSEE